MSEINFGDVKPLQFYHAYGEKILELYHSQLASTNDSPDAHIPFPQEWSKDEVPPQLGRTRPIERIAIVGAGVSRMAWRRWVAGALESAERGAYQILKLHKFATGEEDDLHNAVKEFKESCNPVMGVKKKILKLQLCVSMKLQLEEFHGEQQAL